MAREPLYLAVWRANRRLPVVLLGLLLINILIYFLPLRILASQADAVQREYIHLQAQQRNQSGTGGLLTPPEVYALGVDDMQRFRQSIPDQKELSGLVEELSRLAEKSGLSITRVQYNPELDTTQDLLHYGFGFEVIGTYAQVKKMVHAVEQSSRLLSIDELSLSSTQADGSVRLRLKLTTFFRTGKV